MESKLASHRREPMKLVYFLFCSIYNKHARGTQSTQSCDSNYKPKGIANKLKAIPQLNG